MFRLWLRRRQPNSGVHPGLCRPGPGPHPQHLAALRIQTDQRRQLALRHCGLHVDFNNEVIQVKGNLAAFPGDVFRWHTATLPPPAPPVLPSRCAHKASSAPAVTCRGTPSPPPWSPAPASSPCPPSTTRPRSRVACGYGQYQQLDAGQTQCQACPRGYYYRDKASPGQIACVSCPHCPQSYITPGQDSDQLLDCSVRNCTPAPRAPRARSPRGPTARR